MLQPSQLLFIVRSAGKEYKIYTDGNVEGFEELA